MAKVDISSEIELEKEERKRIQEKIGRVLDKYLKDVRESLRRGHVFVEKWRKSMVEISFRMKVPGKKVIRAVAKGKNIKEATLKLREKIERQARKWRTKIMRKRE